MDFVGWVLTQRHRDDDNLRYLAREIASDPPWPRDVYTLADMDAYMDAWPAISFIREAVHVAWAVYEREVIDRG